MTVTRMMHSATPAQGVLALWAAEKNADSFVQSTTEGLRFAFYGRVSTEDRQDPATSKARQLLGEVVRARMRSRTSMTVQARDQAATSAGGRRTAAGSSMRDRTPTVR